MTTLQGLLSVNDRVEMVARWLWKHQFVGPMLIGLASAPFMVGLIFLFSVVMPRNDAVLVSAVINGFLVGGLSSLVYAYLARRFARKPG